jgi:UDP-2,3-diacylglucosamine pyrophosphatase LpxH
LPGVVTGHTHFAEDTHVNDIHYVNTGSWTETPCAYVTVDSKGLMLHNVSD